MGRTRGDCPNRQQRQQRRKPGNTNTFRATPPEIKGEQRPPLGTLWQPSPGGMEIMGEEEFQTGLDKLLGDPNPAEAKST
jgi:hypothetical protein